MNVIWLLLLAIIWQAPVILIEVPPSQERREVFLALDVIGEYSQAGS